LPLLAAGAAFKVAARINDASAIVGGASVLSGFLFGVVIYVFQVRQGLSNDPRVQRQARLPRLVDELFANVLYAVVVSFVATVLALVVASSQGYDPKGVLVPTDPWLTAVFVLVAVHLLAVVAMSIRRLRRAYIELRS
jgi:cbb3-type cytochrome oxidase subunit 1